MESWRKVWRNGVVPLVSVAGLKALLAALRTDDVKVIQGTTTSPPPLMCVQDWPCEASDALTFMFWQDGLDTVGECEEAWARACFEIDQRMGEPAACRWFLSWYDETPRGEMRRLLIAEVDRALEVRVGGRHGESQDVPNLPQSELVTVDYED